MFRSRAVPLAPDVDPPIIVVMLHLYKQRNTTAYPYISAVHGSASCRTMASRVYFGQM